MLPSPFHHELGAVGDRRRNPHRRAGARPAGAGSRAAGRQAARGGLRTRGCRRRSGTGLCRSAIGTPGRGRRFRRRPQAVVRHDRAEHRRTAVVGRRPRGAAVAVDAADAGRLPAALAAGTARRQRRTRRALGDRLVGARPRRRSGQDRGPDGCRARKALGETAVRVGVVRGQRAGAAPVDAVRLRAVAGADPSTSSPRWAPRSTSTACSTATTNSPRCGCAAGSTGSNATERAASWSWTSRPARRPVSKDDAQRHAQLAMYQLAIAEGLLPQGDSPGGGRLVYLGRTGAAGPTEREQDALTAGCPRALARAGAERGGGDAGAAVPGPHQRRLRALPGTAELPRPGGRPTERRTS